MVADPSKERPFLVAELAVMAVVVRLEIGPRPTIDELLAMIKADRNWNEAAARQQLLKFFEALGFTDPLAVAGRKRLSTILFS